MQRSEKRSEFRWQNVHHSNWAQNECVCGKCFENDKACGHLSLPGRKKPKPISFAFLLNGFKCNLFDDFFFNRTFSTFRPPGQDLLPEFFVHFSILSTLCEPNNNLYFTENEDTHQQLIANRSIGCAAQKTQINICFIFISFYFRRFIQFIW